MSFVYRRLRNKKSMWEVYILTTGYIEVKFKPNYGKGREWLFTKQNQIQDADIPKSVKKCCHNAFYEQDGIMVERRGGNEKQPGDYPTK